MAELGMLFKAIFEAWDTPIVLPWFGQTSFFKMSVTLGVMSIMCALVAGLLGGKNDD